MTEPTSAPIKIANCSGFFGDRLSAAREMVEGGPIDALTGDWLAELTMLILARIRAKRPGAGYARTFVTQMEQVMGTCVDKGIKVVSNAGGIDVRQCAEAVAEVGDKLGLSPTIAFVEGDNLLPRIDELRAAGVDITNFATGEPVADIEYISANAYLGCWGIVEALERGADIVITGRTTDAALVCGPAAWRHGWNRDNWDNIAGGVVAGHIIECGTNTTGGNYSFFKEIPGLERPGFPIAEIAADGSSVITKHDGTGGAVTVGTVTAQLLYEVGGPSYLGPDVSARFDTIDLEQVGRDRVLVSGVKGEPPPSTLKVSMNSWAGYRTDIQIPLTGLDIEAKAEVAEAGFWAASPVAPDDLDVVDTRLVRSDHEDPATNETATATLRITVKDTDERKCKAIGVGVNEIGLANVPGLFVMRRVGAVGEPYGVLTSGKVPADVVPQLVGLLGGESTVVESGGPHAEVVVEPPHIEVPASPAGSTVRAPLGLVAGARSGDKGGDANVGVFARSAEAYAWLDDMLTVDKLRELLPEAEGLEVERHPLPNIWSINFVIRGILQEGGAASTRQDGLAKSLCEWLRARHVDIPESLLESSGA